MITFQQGDLVFEVIKKLPKKIKKSASNVLAEDKKTGHKYEMIYDEVCIYEDVEGNKYLDLEHITDLVHPKYKTVRIFPGRYEVCRKRDYNPFRKRDYSFRD